MTMGIWRGLMTMGMDGLCRAVGEADGGVTGWGGERGLGEREESQGVAKIRMDRRLT